MHHQEILFYLTIWGAILSSILAIIKIFEYKSYSKSNLYLVATVHSPFNNISIVGYNKGKKPMSIKSLKIGYGDFFEGNPYNGKKILQLDEKKSIKLSEGDYYIKEINIHKLNIELHKIISESNYYKRLYVKLLTITNEEFITMVYIDPSIISFEYFKPAEQFIATDILLGFEIKKPIIYANPPFSKL